MLRKIRTVSAALFFIGITLLLIGIKQEWFRWMAKLQFLPACLGMNMAAIVLILGITLVFGRVYCSVICPLGVYQDLVIWIRRKIEKLTKNRHPKRFKYSKPNKWLKYGVLSALLLCLVVGIQPLVALISPYSAYGRIVSSFTDPRWPVWLIGIISFIGISLCAWFWGRAWCNDICPVGTILGLVSRYSSLKPRMIGKGCTHCGRCEKSCKASCIDATSKSIDYDRCIDCFECIGACKEGVIQYSKPKHKKKKKTVSTSRRNALRSIAAITGIFATQRIQAQSKTPLTPPGSSSPENFYSRCTACQLCIRSCPNGVLVPSSDLEHFMQPKMVFDKSYCREECNICSTVCPTGAIKKLEKYQKMDIQIGFAQIDHDSCLTWSGKDHCESCFIHCPSSAIRMLKPELGSEAKPYVVESRCIGCGACESLCPVKPASAIHVEGYKNHISK